ncbi:zinc finger and BTB domain-containing protein 8A.2-like isoform X1 [Mixophyes fleayi]|uniref:zinc finger and BTB domain-containing protein 8A.2-like isoform X1 n=1 Tax=Mixophyes fleayi TaxID=3061075 RepID=UPI003F4DA5F8
MDFSSHHIRLLQQLDEQRRKDLFCDCHIMVEGQMFKAHRNILFASSGYFKMLLSQSCKDASQPTTATFDAFSADTLAAILDFVYSGKLPLSGQNVIEVMSAASYLQMTDVISVCKMFIKSSLDINEKDRDGHYSMSDRDLRRHSDRYGVYSEGWGMDCCHSNQKHSNISGCIENDHSWNAYGIYPRTSELSSNQTNKTTATKTLVRRHDVQQLPSSTCSPENLESECNNSETISTTCGTDLLNDRYATEATEANLNCWTVTQHRASKTDQLYASMPTIMGVVGGWGEDVLPSMRFKCPFCTHMVKRKTDLKRHLRCHTGERPYPCKVCGKRFTRLEHVRTHFRTPALLSDGLLLEVEDPDATTIYPTPRESQLTADRQDETQDDTPARINQKRKRRRIHEIAESDALAERMLDCANTLLTPRKEQDTFELLPSTLASKMRSSSKRIQTEMERLLCDVMCRASTEDLWLDTCLSSTNHRHQQAYTFQTMGGQSGMSQPCMTSTLLPSVRMPHYAGDTPGMDTSEILHYQHL